MENIEGETLFLYEELTIKGKNELNVNPLELISKLDEAVKRFVKLDIYKNFFQIAAVTFDYTSMWRCLASNPVSFQSLFIINEICFYHDLSYLLVCFEKNVKSDQELNLLTLAETLSVHADNFFQSWKSSLSKCNFIHFNQFLYQIYSHIEYIHYLIKNEAYSLSCFEYFGMPKFTIDCAKKNFLNLNSLFFLNTINNCKNLIVNNTLSTSPNLSKDSEFLKKFASDETYFDISLVSLNNKVNYGFEICNQADNFIVTPAVQQIFIQTLSMISSHTSFILKGVGSCGKFESLKVPISSLLILFSKYSIFFDEKAKFCFLELGALLGQAHADFQRF